MANTPLNGDIVTDEFGSRSSSNHPKGQPPQTIRIDPEVWSALQKLAEPLVDNPNDVLRRLLGLERINTTGRGAKICGYAPTRVLHWMGKQGWDFAKAKKALAVMGATGLKDATIRTGLTDGRNPKYAKPAQLSKEQIQQLEEAAK